MRKTLSLLTCIGLLFVATNTQAQEPTEPYTIGTWHELDSKILGEKRPYIVSIPHRYEEGTGKYVVIYVLDGDMHFQQTVGLVYYLRRTGQIPPAMVVAVPNTDRTRDLTPKPSKPQGASPTEGGADNFLQFIEEELVPEVDKNYRTTSHRVLIGHSLGGRFALHSFVNKPDLFDGYIAISPSAQWDDQSIVGEFESFLEGRPALNKSLYLTSGNEGGGLTGGVLKLGGVMKQHRPEGFEWDMSIMDDEGHGPVVSPSTLYGLRFVFKSWLLSDAVALYDKSGIEGYRSFFGEAEKKYGIDRKMVARNLFKLAWDLLGAGRLVDALTVAEYDVAEFAPPEKVYSYFGMKFLEEGDKDRAKHCYIEAYKAGDETSVTRDALVSLGVDPETIVKPPQD